ncbi:hypothetical protein V1498_18190 [Peribacillus sp. SCS-26]|uniref:hypothetical protein n=1 Tax=Paraperibacillus marinus TaxID=3115295 RepID=UPI0039069EC0
MKKPLMRTSCPSFKPPELEYAKQEISSLQKELMGVQKGQKELELTVMKDRKETTEQLRPFVDHVLRQVERGGLFLCL